ncbi:Piso0_003686 [Millerozyma farinosa CBS 7064]|uniref:Piso0_003686 protein n=1 Tax=Pichia sorbitophila (strain ATCC MYA-4447 / BCRC 22081 / CBS 7064 / NBRC 10061 / NRRL Y-12695) TaxID=559304 RepID=G8YAR0_PICSO|nr:Piso0_003686 [Millerozyma farinosa CBS 7064]CCE84145.1 Piso0_003686 [Millerozyma farinosa CBS 7064]
MVAANKALIVAVLASTIQAFPVERTTDIERRDLIGGLVNLVEGLLGGLLKAVEDKLECIADVVLGGNAQSSGATDNQYTLAVILANGFYDYRSQKSFDSLQSSIKSVAQNNPGLLNTLANDLGVGITQNVQGVEKAADILVKFVESVIEVLVDDLSSLGGKSVTSDALGKAIQKKAASKGLVLNLLTDEINNAAQLVIKDLQWICQVLDHVVNGLEGLVQCVVADLLDLRTVYNLVDDVLGLLCPAASHSSSAVSSTAPPSTSGSSSTSAPSGSSAPSSAPTSGASSGASSGSSAPSSGASTGSGSPSGSSAPTSGASSTGSGSPSGSSAPTSGASSTGSGSPSGSGASGASSATGSGSPSGSGASGASSATGSGSPSGSGASGASSATGSGSPSGSGASGASSATGSGASGASSATGSGSPSGSGASGASSATGSGASGASSATGSGSPSGSGASGASSVAPASVSGAMNGTSPQSTKTEYGHTVVTITSCSENKCSETPVTTGLTTVTKDSTVYTTYCPLSTESSAPAPAPSSKAPESAAPASSEAPASKAPESGAPAPSEAPASSAPASKAPESGAPAPSEAPASSAPASQAAESSSAPVAQSSSAAAPSVNTVSQGGAIKAGISMGSLFAGAALLLL